MHSRAGYYWQAIRENEDAAQALGINTFRWKMLAVVISAAMTALAGVFSAFYYGSLFPEQLFSINRSVEIILGPIIGGIGTIFGPIVGAALLTVLAEGTSEIVVAAFGWEVPGIKQLIYGIVLFAVIVFLPHGIWPRWRASSRCVNERSLNVQSLSKSFRGLRAVANVSFEVEEGAIVALIGPNGAGKTTIFNMVAGALRPDDGAIFFAGKSIDGLRPIRSARSASAELFRS